MEEQSPATTKPALQKPPGYRDPAAPPPRYPIRPTPLRATNPKHGRRRPCRRCCCCFFVFVLLVLIIVAAAGGFSYLWFQPKLPTFRLDSVQIAKFDVTSKADSSSLNATTKVKIKIGNPNKKIGISLTSAEVLISVGEDVSLGSGKFAGFYLERGNSSVVKVETNVKGSALDESLGRRLRSEFRAKSLRVVVELRTKVMISHGGPSVPVKIVCGGVSLKQINAGNAQKCVINIFKLINLH